MPAVVMITVSCVLFVGMGLSEAVQETLDVRLRIISCPKCLTFWCVLLHSLLGGGCIVTAVASAFVASYCALWLTLAVDALTSLYNKLYEKIDQPGTETQAGEDSTPAGPLP